MYELYIANKNYSSWSLRPWVLLRERGIEFIERIMPFSDNGNFDAFRAFSPTGKVRCLRDGAGTVWELTRDSLSVIEQHHPDIARCIHLNLSRSLAERLRLTTLELRIATQN